MRERLKGLERIALVYAAMKHANGLSLERAAAALHDTEAKIDQQRSQVRGSSQAGREALEAGEHVEWKMREAQNQFTEWNAEKLAELRQQREDLMLEAAEVYRAGRMQLEQMESVVREARSKLEAKRVRKTQRESDDRFLAQRWWQERAVPDPEEDPTGA